MLVISKDEFQTNIDKYIVLGQEEEIQIMDQDKVLFYIEPKKVVMLRKVESMFGSLPREAYYDTDIDRE